MEIYSAPQYTVRCNNNTCGLLCNLKIIYFGRAPMIKIIFLRLWFTYHRVCHYLQKTVYNIMNRAELIKLEVTDDEV